MKMKLLGEGRVFVALVAPSSLVYCVNAFTISAAPLVGVGGGPLLKSRMGDTASSVAKRTLAHRRPDSTALQMSQEEMELITMDADERMDKTLSNLAENLSTIRTGRANPNMLDRVEADYYGVKTPINQMASISVPSSQQLTISPFDKSSVTDIEKAIIDSGLGFTPTSDGSVIRINIPQLTEERRKDLLKQCKSIGEEAKVAIRNIRRDGVAAVNKMEKAGDLGKDQALDGIDSIQKMTDDHIKSVDESVGKKEKEVTTL